jgi:hypothetical protein
MPEHWAVVLVLVALFGSSSAGLAANYCDGVARSNVAAVQNPKSILKRGRRLEAITQMEIDKKTQAIRYCAHGSYCYPAGAIELQGCAIATSPAAAILPDEDRWIYDVTGPASQPRPARGPRQ